MLKLLAQVPKRFGGFANAGRAIFYVKEGEQMQLGKNIYDLRKQKGLSQEKLAEQINVTRQTISNWELGETSPNPEQLILLSRAFNKSIDELVGNKAESVGSQNGHAKSRKGVYLGLAVICGLASGIWSFSTNRFRFDEILLMILAGMIIGICAGIVRHGILKYMK